MLRPGLFFIQPFLTFRSIDKPTPSYRTMIRPGFVVCSTVDIKTKNRCLSDGYLQLANYKQSIPLTDLKEGKCYELDS
ncbi:hypothetical protein Ava_4916 [Trichormus variabilis ATCC 29413]|uniref:Uncharacterized protein n=1 Tax=Trichormus variabilis (strain ATCC 29413 / PCC 7937) TaxID=240292 RepID=Q3M3C3_TRIV2|nr:hypothetical protein Ava_4916 [Trichormus variabilis ATCC 29413]